ncbi:putative lipoprotein [Burkholderia lata]|nr:putative lipoprotein [Burkholderia lata]
MSIMSINVEKRENGCAMLHLGWKVSVAGAIMFALSGCTDLAGVLYCNNSQVNFPDYHCFQPY